MYVVVVFSRCLCCDDYIVCILAAYSTRAHKRRNMSATLQGSLTLSFFERRASRQLFGLVSHEEQVV